MDNSSVCLSDPDSNSLLLLAAHFCMSSLHVVHLAALRVGMREGLVDPTIIEEEIVRIQKERQERRRQSRRDNQLARESLQREAGQEGGDK